MDESLYPKRLAILRLLARRAGESEAPTTREIASYVGLSSAQTVHHHLGRLEDDGFIERGDAPSRKRRPIRLTERGWSLVGTATVMGRVAAGRGLEAIPDEGAYSLIQLLEATNGDRRYLLRSVGQSMIGAGIEDGDLLIVEKNEDPPDGSIVVALLHDGDEVTVKELRREGDTVRLAPKNGDHEEIVVSAGDVMIQGEVVYIIHRTRR